MLGDWHEIEEIMSKYYYEIQVDWGFNSMDGLDMEKW